MKKSVAKNRHFIFGVLLATIVLGACNFKDEKDQAADDGTGVTIDPNTPITFAEIQTKILQPKCVSCHSIGGSNQGGVNLETYAAVKNRIAGIKSSTVDSDRMPQGDKLSTTQETLLKVWIEQGAPE